LIWCGAPTGRSRERRSDRRRSTASALLFLVSSRAFMRPYPRRRAAGYKAIFGNESITGSRIPDRLAGSCNGQTKGKKITFAHQRYDVVSFLIDEMASLIWPFAEVADRAWSGESAANPGQGRGPLRPRRRSAPLCRRDCRRPPAVLARSEAACRPQRGVATRRLSAKTWMNLLPRLSPTRQNRIKHRESHSFAASGSAGGGDRGRREACSRGYSRSIASFALRTRENPSEA
jgi:hypothetical protein